MVSKNGLFICLFCGEGEGLFICFSCDEDCGQFLTRGNRQEERGGGGRRKGECWGRDLFEGSPIFISLLKIIDVISEEGEDVPCSDSCCEEGEDVPYSGDVSAEWECGKEYAKHSVERIVLIFNNSIT